MAATVGNLVVRIGADVGGLVRGGRDASGAIDRVGKSAGDVTRRIAALGAAVSSVALVGFAKQAIDAASAIEDTADKLGVSTTMLQEWRFAAERAGVAQNTFDMALQRFTRRSAEAAKGTGEAKAALEALGVTLTDSTGKLRPTEDLLKDVADALAAVPSEADRVRLAFKLFDSEGVALVNLLGKGSRQIEEFQQRARDLGVIINEDMIRRAGEAGDALDDMGNVLKVAGMNIALEFLPVIQQLAAIFTSEEFRSGIRSLTGELSTLIKWMSENVETIERFAGAYAGFRTGRVFGGWGAVAGGAAGAFLPEIRGALGGGKESNQIGMDAGLGDLDNQIKLANEKKYLEQREKLRAEYEERQKAIDAKLSEEKNKKTNDDNIKKLDEIRKHLMSTQELEVLAHQQRMEQLQAAFDAELIGREEFHRLKEELEAKHQEKLVQLAAEGARKAAREQQRMWGDRLRAASSFMGNLESIAEAGGEKALAAQKVLAIASAIVAGIESASHAFNFGSRIGGPVVGGAMAAAAFAAQMSRVAAIRSTSKGSSSAGGGGGGGGAVAAPPPTPVAQQQESRSVNINLSGRLFNSDQIRELIGQLNEEMGEGTKLHINPV